MSVSVEIIMGQGNSKQLFALLLKDILKAKDAKVGHQ